MSEFIETQWTNPDGSVVTIWMHQACDRASIGEWARIGEGARIGDRASIGEWARIGDRASIGAGASIGEWARIGEGARIGDRASIGAGASIGEWARIGAWARIGEWARIGDRASIGAGASIGEGARIGDRASIGEGDDTAFPIYLSPLPGGPRSYTITITAKNIAIGCQLHSLAEWAEFDDQAILAMDVKSALAFWRRYKETIFSLAAGEGWWPATAEPAEAYVSDIEGVA